MSISLTLKQTYGLAALRQEVRALRTGKDWEAAQHIMDRHAKAQQHMEARYRAEYETRVEVTLKALINKAGSKTRQLNHPWFGADRFNSDDLTRQAHRAVQHAHANDLSRAQRAEADDLSALRTTARLRDGGGLAARFAHKSPQQRSQTRTR